MLTEENWLERPFPSISQQPAFTHWTGTRGRGPRPDGETLLRATQLSSLIKCRVKPAAKSDPGKAVETPGQERRRGPGSALEGRFQATGGKIRKSPLEHCSLLLAGNKAWFLCKMCSAPLPSQRDNRWRKKGRESPKRNKTVRMDRPAQTIFQQGKKRPILYKNYLNYTARDTYRILQTERFFWFVYYLVLLFFNFFGPCSLIFFLML